MLGMRIVADIDVLGDASVQRKVARLSLALLVAGAVAVVAVAIAEKPGEPRGLAWWLALVVAYLVCLPVHELIHAVAFKALSPGCRVTFGAQGGFVYACANGAVLSRRRMVAVLAAPAVLLTAAVAGLALLAGLPLMATALAALHLASCAGDLLMVCEIAAEPACTHVCDTECGIELLEETP